MTHIITMIHKTQLKCESSKNIQLLSFFSFFFFSMSGHVAQVFKTELCNLKRNLYLHMP